MRDSSGFDEFYATTAPRLVAQLYAMIGDLGEAEDAVQEAFARAWQRWRRISGYADPAAWVRTVAYRIAVSSWRRTRVRVAAHERLSRGAESSVLNPDTLALVDALRQLSPDQRRAIVLHHLAGLPIQAIADETGASVAAVKTRLFRGRQALAPILGIREQEVDHSGR
jgi:RNA polymerase sigma-70 factor (ECF subfamily)